MKRFLSLFLAIVLAVGALLSAPIQLPGLVVSASAETTVPEANAEPEIPGATNDVPIENYIDFTLDPVIKCYTISINSNATGELVIPATYNDIPVIKIVYMSPEATVTKLVIPDTVQYIANYAFADNTTLESVTLSKNIEIIPRGAFNGCTSLKSIDIPEGVLIISNFAFKGCSSLSEISIADSVTDIAGDALLETEFYENPDNWEDGVLYIDNHLIATNDNIAEMYRIKAGTIHIAVNAFKDRQKLLALYMPKSIKRIDDKAFVNCSSLAFIFYEGTAKDLGNIYYFSGNQKHLENTNIILEATGSGIPTKPTVKSVSNVAGGVQISWNAADNADVYLVWRRGSGNSEWTLLGMTDQTTAIDISAGHRQYWRYSVQGMNFDEVSEFDYTGKYLKYVATPKLTGISNATNGIYFKWNKVDGASGYRVYRRSAGGNWQYIATVKGTSYTDTAVKNASGNYYRYTVRAVVDGVYSGFEDLLFTKRLANPTLKSATNGNGGITVKWSAIKGTTGYYVYRKTANSNWVRIGAVGGTNNTTFLDKTAKSGTTYTYTVRAVYGKTTSYFNSGIKCKRK